MPLMVVGGEWGYRPSLADHLVDLDDLFTQRDEFLVVGQLLAHLLQFDARKRS